MGQPTPTVGSGDSIQTPSLNWAEIHLPDLLIYGNSNNYGYSLLSVYHYVPGSMLSIFDVISKLLKHSKVSMWFCYIWGVFREVTLLFLAYPAIEEQIETQALWSDPKAKNDDVPNHCASLPSVKGSALRVPRIIMPHLWALPRARLHSNGWMHRIWQQPMGRVWLAWSTEGPDQSPHKVYRPKQQMGA